MYKTTLLHSAFDFKDFRESMNPMDAYLDGRFGAIPFIDEQIGLEEI